MQATNVRKIKEAIYDQAMRGRRQVHAAGHQRVVDVKREKGQLKAKLLNGIWIAVDAVTID
jgi:hypothetical protein